MNPISVLLIEDDEDDYLITSELLEAIEGRSYEVTWASDATCGAAELRSGNYDVCLIDYRLGGITGVEVLEQCGESLRSTPAILLTGKHSAEVDRAAMEAGASDYLVKSELTSDMLERTARYAMQRRESDTRIEYLAFHDPLTDLPNRVLFADRVQQALNRADRAGGEVFVIFFDIDNFKDINDTRGHAAGDLLLTQVASRIRTALRVEDTLARLGGDEFAICLETQADKDPVIFALERTREVLSKTFDIDSGNPVEVTVSFGIASTRDTAAEPEQLLRNADIAMYESKRRSKNTFSFYERTMHDALQRRIALEHDLRCAIRKGELAVHYQPFVSLETSEVKGFEALARWTHPEFGVQSPQDFVRLAEESSLILELGEYVLNRAMDDAALWVANGFEGFVSVNVSPRQILDSTFLDSLNSVMHRCPMEPGRLVIEFTESVMSEDIGQVVETLDKAAELGAGIALDDFGTGYSSLSNVHQLPISILKIDRSFISRHQDRKGLSMLKTIATMAESLDLLAIAEGIETVDQLASIRSLGFDLGQGFLFSRAVEAKDVPALLSAPLGPCTTILTPGGHS